MRQKMENTDAEINGVDVLVTKLKEKLPWVEITSIVIVKNTTGVGKHLCVPYVYPTKQI